MESYSIRDRAAMQAEINRLRRIEAKADSGIREAVARRIRELQNHIQNVSAKTGAQNNAA